MKQLTQDQQHRIGSELGRILKSDSFCTAVEILNDELTSRVFHSEFHQKVERESAYATHQALQELINIMSNLSSIADGISLSLEADEEDDGLNQF